jgi:replication factor C subunit 3/5
VFKVKMPDPVRIELISRMADVEYRLAFAVSERLQLGSLVGAFAEAKEGLVKAAA